MGTKSTQALANGACVSLSLMNVSPVCGEAEPKVSARSKAATRSKALKTVWVMTTSERDSASNTENTAHAAAVGGATANLLKQCVKSIAPAAQISSTELSSGVHGKEVGQAGFVVV